jgi:flagellar protein FliS
MNCTNPWQRYRKIATETAGAGQLILMLFDGILRFLEQAQAGFRCEDPLEFNRTISNNILRAQAIITELDLCLDMQRGGEFSQKMRGLYTYFDRRLQESNIRKTDEGIQEVMTRVAVLRDAWAEMLATKCRDDSREKTSANPCPPTSASLVI